MERTDKNNRGPMRAARAVLLCAGIIVCSVLCGFVFGSVVSWLLLVLASAAYALLIKKAHVAFAFVCPILSAAFALLLPSLTLAGRLCCIVWMLSGITLSLAVKARASKTEAVFAVAASLALGFFAVVFVGMTLEGGRFSFETLLDIIKAEAAKAAETSAGLLREGGFEVTEEYVRSFELVPAYTLGLVLSAAGIVSYLIVLAFSFLLGRFGFEDEFSSLKAPLSASRISAVLYIIAYVVYSFSDLRGDMLLPMAAYNLIIILTPLFTAIGFAKIFGHLAPSRGGGRRGLPIVLLALFLFSSGLILLFAVLLGLWSSILKKKTNPDIG